MTQAYRIAEMGHVTAGPHESVHVSGFDVSADQREALVGEIVESVGLGRVPEHHDIGKVVLLENGSVAVEVYDHVVEEFGYVPEAPHDDRTDKMKVEMAEHFRENEAEYRDSDWASVVYEDSEVVLVEDHKGYEFSEWSDEYGRGFGEIMHDLADQLVDRRWPATYPLVFDKLED